MRPKVVKILCSRIVITNENRAEIENFIDDIKKLNVFFEVTGSGNAHILDISADDGKLYEVCCVVSSFIMATEVKKTARCILNAEYPNFNRDEKILIVRAVMGNDEFSELPGRLYIYLKHGGTVNPNGFFRFMCRDLDNRIYDMVCEEADKMMSVSDMADFISLLRYFASMSPVCCERADIIAGKHSIRLLIPPDGSRSFATEFADMDFIGEDALSELVTLNPKRIVVHGRQYYEGSETASIVDAVFEGRITFCTGCSLCEKTF